eukprot:scaffold229256_cov39-Prasinocladus_malaysianus.AAC.1
MSRTYDNFSKDVHNFSGEFRFLRRLRDEGRLQICSEADPRTCGYSEEQVREIERQALQRGGAPEAPEEYEEVQEEDAAEDEGDDSVEGNDEPTSPGKAGGHIWDEAEAEGEGAQF